jgi:hypothetical protein
MTVSLAADNFLGFSNKDAEQCTICKRWYITSNVQCTVAHAPGTCCHRYDAQVEAPAPRPSQWVVDLFNAVCFWRGM